MALEKRNMESSVCYGFREGKEKKHEKGLQRIQNGNQVLNLRETLWTKKTCEDVSNDVKKVWVFREGRVCDL